MKKIIIAALAGMLTTSSANALVYQGVEYDDFTFLSNVFNAGGQAALDALQTALGGSNETGTYNVQTGTTGASITSANWDAVSDALGLTGSARITDRADFLDGFDVVHANGAKEAVAAHVAAESIVTTINGWSGNWTWSKFNNGADRLHNDTLNISVLYTKYNNTWATITAGADTAASKALNKWLNDNNIELPSGSYGTNTLLNLFPGINTIYNDAHDDFLATRVNSFNPDIEITDSLVKAPTTGSVTWTFINHTGLGQAAVNFSTTSGGIAAFSQTKTFDFGNGVTVVWPGNAVNLNGVNPNTTGSPSQWQINRSKELWNNQPTGGTQNYYNIVDEEIVDNVLIPEFIMPEVTYNIANTSGTVTHGTHSQSWVSGGQLNIRVGNNLVKRIQLANSGYGGNFHNAHNINNGTLLTEITGKTKDLEIYAEIYVDGFEVGYEDGYQDGFATGYKDGFAAGVESATKP